MMTKEMIYMVGIIAICTFVTVLTRSLPFVCFSKRKLSPIMDHLAKALPRAIMVILVIYCLKDMTLNSWIDNIPEMISCMLVFLLQYRYKNMYLAIVCGTLCYMLFMHII